MKPPFKNLAAARKAGWSIRCRNIGPPDWVHYGAFIQHEPSGRNDFLSDPQCSWDLPAARKSALDRINELEAPSPDPA